MPQPFFPATRSTLKSLTDTFDFVWPTATAMWNLRWNVKGFLEICPDTDETTLAGRFVAGSGIVGTNLRRACIEQTWEQQQERFAEILLTSLFALYESWCEQMATALHFTSSNGAKRIQFATKVDPTGKKIDGVGEVLDRLAHSNSPIMVDLIYPVLTTHPKCQLAHLEDYLAIYRYFKELRNCLMHRGGLADQKCVAAFSALPATGTPNAIGMKEYPQHTATVLGHQVSLSLRGVVGFSDVLVRLMVTLDAEFSKHHEAERMIVESWRNFNMKRYMLPAEATARARTLRRLVAKLGWKTTLKTQGLEAVLRHQKLCN